MQHPNRTAPIVARWQRRMVRSFFLATAPPHHRTTHFARTHTPTTSATLSFQAPHCFVTASTCTPPHHTTPHREVACIHFCFALLLVWLCLKGLRYICQFKCKWPCDVIRFEGRAVDARQLLGRPHSDSRCRHQIRKDEWALIARQHLPRAQHRARRSRPKFGNQSCCVGHSVAVRSDLTPASDLPTCRAPLFCAVPGQNMDGQQKKLRPRLVVFCRPVFIILLSAFCFRV